VDLRPDHVAVVEWSRGPNNYFSAEVIAALADTLERLAGKGARAAVLCSAGRHFCAGADFGSGRTAALERATTIAANAPLAVQAIRATMRRQRARELRAAVTHERSEQERLFVSPTSPRASRPRKNDAPPCSAVSERIHTHH
jgi:enoyl-CoA hydratase/carnithine racemase